MYLVWNLSDFVNVNLSKDVYAGTLKVLKPNRVSTVTFDVDDYTFPLRAEYIRKNETIEGVREKAADPAGWRAAEQRAAEADEEQKDEARGDNAKIFIPDVPGESNGPTDAGGNQGDSPEVVPPRPTGPHEYTLHNGKWCRPRGGDGRLLPVDSSGTFIRNRKDKAEYARPEHIALEFWETCTSLGATQARHGG